MQSSTQLLIQKFINETVCHQRGNFYFWMFYGNTFRVMQSIFYRETGVISAMIRENYWTKRSFKMSYLNMYLPALKMFMLQLHLKISTK